MFELLIASGTVVTAAGSVPLDVAVGGREIAALGKPGSLGAEAQRVIDAQGLLVLPGAIDPHTHIRPESMGRPIPGWETMSVAAAFGGTTTIIDFPSPGTAPTFRGSLDEKRQEVAGKMAVDYAFHASVNRPHLAELGRALIAEMPSIVAWGVPSFKIYMANNNYGPPAHDGLLYGFLEAAARCGALVCIHAENSALIDFFTEQLLQAGKTEVAYFRAPKPNLTEAEPVSRAIRFAEATGAAIYFVHLSSKEAVALVAEARGRGLPVYGETCPHYLAFTEAVYQEPFERALQFLRFPPIRSAEDQAALWQAVAQGIIDVIGTDHVGARLDIKKELSVGRPFTQMPGGMAQIETRLAYLYSEGVAKGRFPASRLVELVSTNPAKLFGLYPQKGTIAVGSDADLVLLDPRLQKRVTNADLHMGLDYTVFEGMTCTGWPIMTVAKGKVVIEGGQYRGNLSDGEYLFRRIDPTVLKKG